MRAVAKLIVTHHHPDLDAIMSSWLLVRFDQPNFGDAALAFVPAGETYKHQVVDSDTNVVHVDNGRGKFDHHHEGGYETCAAKLVYHDLVEQGKIAPSDSAVKQMVDFALAIDRFEDSSWEDPLATRYAFTLHEVIPALHSLQVMDDEGVTRYVLTYLDGVYQRLKQVHKAEEEIMTGEEFEWTKGRGLAVESGNSEVIKIAQKRGYSLVILKHPDFGHMRIKAVPKQEIDLTALYDKILEVDPAERWYLHPSKQMLLNGSDKTSPKEPTTLTLKEVIELVKKVYK